MLLRRDLYKSIISYFSQNTMRRNFTDQIKKASTDLSCPVALADIPYRRQDDGTGVMDVSYCVGIGFTTAAQRDPCGRKSQSQGPTMRYLIGVFLEYLMVFTSKQEQIIRIMQIVSETANCQRKHLIRRSICLKEPNHAQTDECLSDIYLLRIVLLTGSPRMKRKQ